MTKCRILMLLHINLQILANVKKKELYKRSGDLNIEHILKILIKVYASLNWFVIGYGLHFIFKRMRDDTSL